MFTYDIDISLRDIKYDIDLLDVHGSSYRTKGSDPSLKANYDGLIVIHESKPIHTAPFQVKKRKLNVVEAYGGLEDLAKGVSHSNLTIETQTSMGRLFFPVAQGSGGTQLPIIIPIARIQIQNALVAINASHGDRSPKVSTVEAVENSVEFFIDWEMSHKSHRLLFDTPGYHLGIQGNWKNTQKELKQVGAAGAAFRLAAEHRAIFLRALKLLMKFDQDFIKVALQRCNSNYKEEFFRQAQILYSQMNGDKWFGHQFAIQGFTQAIHMIGERVQSQTGLQDYYEIR